MTRAARDLCLFALILLLPTVSASAQLATAELNGRVTDSSGAVLPGATVTATQTATGLMRSVVTDGNGAYLISNLPTGRSEPEWELYALPLHGHADRHYFQPTECRLSEAGGPVVRRRLLRPGSEAPGDIDDGIRDAGSRQPSAACDRIALAAVGSFPRVPAIGSTSQVAATMRSRALYDF